jgi:hypothetical protein
VGGVDIASQAARMVDRPTAMRSILEDSRAGS